MSPIKESKSHAEHFWADIGLKWLKMTQDDPKNHQKLVYGKKFIKILSKFQLLGTIYFKKIFDPKVS